MLSLRTDLSILLILISNHPNSSRHCVWDSLKDTHDHKKVDKFSPGHLRQMQLQDLFLDHIQHKHQDLIYDLVDHQLLYTII